MADPSPYPDSDGSTSVVPDRRSSPGMPGWVKASGIIVVVLVVVMVILHLTGHNLMNHMPMTP